MENVVIVVDVTVCVDRSSIHDRPDDGRDQNGPATDGLQSTQLIPGQRQRRG